VGGGVTWHRRDTTLICARARRAVSSGARPAPPPPRLAAQSRGPRALCRAGAAGSLPGAGEGGGRGQRASPSRRCALQCMRRSTLLGTPASSAVELLMSAYTPERLHTAHLTPRASGRRVRGAPQGGRRKGGAREGQGGGKGDARVGWRGRWGADRRFSGIKALHSSSHVLFQPAVALRPAASARACTRTRPLAPPPLLRALAQDRQRN